MSFDVTALYDGSFGAAEFWIQDPWIIPTAEEEAVELHHPGGDDNTVIRLGQKTRKLTLTVACVADDHDTLLSLQGTTAQLTFYDGNPTGVYLHKVGEFNVNPIFDVYTGTLEFWYP